MSRIQLASLVRRRRLDLRLTQRQAAAAAGVSLATWQALERDAEGGVFQDLTLSRVAHALDLPLETVFDVARRRPPPEPLSYTPFQAAREPARLSAPEPAGGQPEHLLRSLTDRLRLLWERSEDDFMFVYSQALELTQRLDVSEQADRAGGLGGRSAENG